MPLEPTGCKNYSLQPADLCLIYTPYTDLSLGDFCSGLTVATHTKTMKSPSKELKESRNHLISLLAEGNVPEIPE